MTSKNDEIKRTPAKKNLWYRFMHSSIILDIKHDADRGAYWFWGIYFLALAVKEFPNIDLKVTQNTLPKEHWLKKTADKDVIYVNLLESKEFIALQNALKKIKHRDKVKKIDFSELDFLEDVYFTEDAKEIDFSNFIFPINTDFSNTAFAIDVFFNNAVFLETADFENAKFHKKESYSKETAKFRNTTFKKIANFRNATFWGYANFKGSKLEGRAFFQKAKFKCHAPRFYDATFNNEITWAGIELPNFDTALVDEYKKVDEEFESLKCTECTNRVKCLKPVKCEVFIEENRRRRIEENQNAYENTSILLEKHRKYHDEHFFFRKEMQCRRWLGKSFITRLPHSLYQIFADYGYGVERAFAWWLGNIIAGAYVIAWIVAWVDIRYDESLSCAISASFANANPYIFFGFESSSLKACYTKLDIHIPTSFAIIRAIQSIFGVAILFLFLLTVRIRFRLK